MGAQPPRNTPIAPAPPKVACPLCGESLTVGMPIPREGIKVVCAACGKIIIIKQG